MTASPDRAGLLREAIASLPRFYLSKFHGRMEVMSRDEVLRLLDATGDSEGPPVGPTCVLCGWSQDIGHAEHARFIHPDADLVVIEQMGQKFIVRRATGDSWGPLANVEPQWEACKVCGGDHWTKEHERRIADAIAIARVAWQELQEWADAHEAIAARLSSREADHD